MTIPFGDLKRDYLELKTEIDEAVNRVLKSGHYILGEEGRLFEEEWKNYCGARFAAAVANGTEALYIALKAAGVSYMDEVVTTNVTAVPTISAISMTGAVPVLVDVDENTGLIDTDKIEEKITKKTKAIVPVHLYGQICPMKPILSLAEHYRIPVIEDACQAHGSFQNKKHAGTFGLAGCFSFYPSKNLGCYGDGGAIITDSEELYEKIVKIRNYGQSKRYYHDQIGINSRLDEIQAAILRVKLLHLNDYNERRMKLSALYDEQIKNPGIDAIFVHPFNDTNYHLYVIKTDQRDALQKRLTDSGVETLIHYPVNIHRQQAYRFLQHSDDDFKHSVRFSEHILSLPMYPQLSHDEARFICACLNS